VDRVPARAQNIAGWTKCGTTDLPGNPIVERIFCWAVVIAPRLTSGREHASLGRQGGPRLTRSSRRRCADLLSTCYRDRPTRSRRGRFVTNVIRRLATVVCGAMPAGARRHPRLRGQNHEFRKLDQLAPVDKAPPQTESADNVLKVEELSVWLGGRDLNPDNVVQSHVSYR
jgi:hypothetical protein